MFLLFVNVFLVKLVKRDFDGRICTYVFVDIIFVIVAFIYAYTYNNVVGKKKGRCILVGVTIKFFFLDLLFVGKNVNRIVANF